MEDSLLPASGVFWALAYVLIIKRGFQDKTFGMPLAALCANISWEFIFSFVHLVHPGGVPQAYVDVIWFLCDAVIVFQLLKFWRLEFPDFSDRQFYAVFLLTLVTAFGLVLLISCEFGDWPGAYTAFGQNLMMSILFVAMLLRRNSLRGQSFYIALFKLLGTLLASLKFYLASPFSGVSVLLPFLYVAILAFDALYTVMVYKKCREQAVNPWRRL
jgi:hypothetical protein